jgi:chromosome segregation protein
MKLKKLEITGFKSFRDKMTLDVAEGITCVVGPNGCGKSNIVDALRWVMGEQRVKVLRGKKMEDVIFNGSEEAMPVSMAEVSISLAAGQERFPGIYAECSEVTVSRRIFRDSEGEYAINGIPCRLLDVKEFFMGTGVGTKTYSLVEQNSVSTLVEAKPEERRQFIEEAAGISKYKSRKESAFRKMEQTQQNMLRVSDIIREVKSQLNAISRQAKKAEQYKTLKNAVREAEVTLALQTCADLSREVQLHEKAMEEAHQRQMALQTKLQAREASIGQLKVEILDNEEQLSKTQEGLYKIRNTINIQEQGIEHDGQKTADLAAAKERDRAEASLLRSRHDDTLKELNDLRAEAGSSENRIRELQKIVADKQRQVEDLKAVQRSLYRDLDEQKIACVDLAAEKAKLRNMIAGLTKNIEDVRHRNERDLREIGEQGKRRDELNDILEKLQAEVRSDEEMLEAVKEKTCLANEAYERSKSSLQLIEEDLSGVKEETGSKSSRLQSLKEFQERYEGCHEGVKSLMAARQDDVLEGLSHDVFCGLVADHIDVPEEYETAVEAVLGEKLQYIIVKKQEDGLNAINYLKNYSLGRGSFVPLGVRNHGLNDPERHHEHLKEAVRLIDQVRVPEDFRGIADYLLGDVLVIPSLPGGITLWKQNGFRGTFVTPDGDIINPQGVLTGGNGTGSETGLLRNRREIAELETEMDHLTGRLAEETDNRKKANSRVAEWAEELQHLTSEIHRLELQITGKRKDQERFDDERKRNEQRIRILEFSRESLHAEEHDALTRIADIQSHLTSSEGTEKSLNERIGSLQSRWEVLRGELEQQELLLTGDKIALASLEEKRMAHLNTLTRLDQTLALLVSEIDAKVNDAEACEHRILELTQKIAEDRESLVRLYTESASLEDALTKRKDLQAEKESSLQGIEAESREVKKSLDEVQKENNALAMAIREVRFKMDGLRDHIQTKHDVHFESMKEEFKEIDESERDALASRLDRDRQSLGQFGEVNLLALSEHEELKKRFEFLTAQAADLNNSLETLQKTISRINAISRKRFAETFEMVNEYFKQVFTKLFPGGKGELRLTDEIDMLETGVDIDIQIPGKKAQSVSLLSGGEKSLAAIALIFAILMYRPTPFLVLDEVDAALDDANIELFNRLVREISEKSQVVMVTHNKRTMEVASHLFGVTMQKHGISSMVSVSLN